MVLHLLELGIPGFRWSLPGDIHGPNVKDWKVKIGDKLEKTAAKPVLVG
jgi:hypothetical protein